MFLTLKANTSLQSDPSSTDSVNNDQMTFLDDCFTWAMVELDYLEHISNTTYRSLYGSFIKNRCVNTTQLPVSVNYAMLNIQ